MNVLLTVGVLAAPMLAGLFLALLLLRPSLPATWLSAVGHALLLGLLLATLVLRVQDALGLPLAPVPFLLLAAPLALTLGFLWWLDRSRDGAGAVALTGGSVALSWPMRVASLALLLLILLHLVLPAIEASLRPVYGWDATMHWATKARVWFAEGRLVPFVDSLTWLQQEPGRPVFMDTHPDYPPTISLLQLWMCVAFQRWSDTLINVPWPVLQVSLALIFYGESRDSGASIPAALGFTFLLLSLPLINTHAALAGYADLPLGICMLAALVSLVRGLRERQSRRLVLALGLIVMATHIKNEGFFWAVALLPAALVCALPRRRAYGLLVTLAVGVLLLLFFLPPDLEVAGHSLDSLRIAYRDGAAAALLVQFFTDVWHSFALVLAFALFGFAVLERRDARIAAVGVFVLVSIALYLFLFTYTRFSYGAYHATASPRIALHLVPSITFLALLVWQGLMSRGSGREPITAEERPVLPATDDR